MPLIRKSNVTLKTGGLPFFRYSKFCFIEWAASVYLIIYGCIYDTTYLIIGLALFLFSPILNELALNLWTWILAKLNQSDELAKLIAQELKDPDTFPIVYSPGYNITACGFENLHPFDSKKYGRIW